MGIGTLKLKSVSAVVINKNGKILLLKRAFDKKYNPGQWNVVAGKLDENYSPEEKILSEIKEELGVGAKILLKSQPWYIYQEKQNTIFEDIPFLVVLKSTNIVLNQEHDNYKWVDVHNLENLEIVPFLEQNLHQIGITTLSHTYSVLYTNYKGKTKWRKIIPQNYFLGTTEYHTKEQWLLKVHDVEKDAERTYAVADIQIFLPPLFFE